MTNDGGSSGLLLLSLIDFLANLTLEKSKRRNFGKTNRFNNKE